jgi:GntR family phosphonate transport system transcriptional regulator
VRAHRPTGSNPGGPSATSAAAPASLWRTVANDIEEQIALGKLAPGKRLRTEASIAEDHSVTRQTVRTAIADLARKGLVKCVPGRGAYVASPKITYSLADKATFYENIIRAGRTPTCRVLTARRTTAPIEMATWLGLARRSEVVEMDYLGFANGVPVLSATTWLPADRCARIPELFQRTSNFAKSFQAIGISTIVRKAARLTVTEARALEAEALCVTVGAKLLMIESLYTDQHGEPVQVARALFPSDLVEIVVGG